MSSVDPNSEFENYIPRNHDHDLWRRLCVVDDDGEGDADVADVFFFFEDLLLLDFSSNASAFLFLMPATLRLLGGVAFFLFSFSFCCTCTGKRTSRTAERPPVATRFTALRAFSNASFSVFRMTKRTGTPSSLKSF